jgi:hypothetical protein
MVMTRTFTTLLAAGGLAFSTSMTSAQSLRGTASTFWTTAPGVSNFSATPLCDNCGVMVDTDAYQGSASAMASVPLASTPPAKQQDKKPRAGKSVSNTSAR